MVIPHIASSVKNQLVIYDLLLETRIKIQKLLISANTLPHYDTYQQFLQLGGKDLEISRLEAKTKLKELQNALIKLLLLSRSIFSSKMDESDEEIESETDDRPEISAKLNIKNQEISIAGTSDENIHDELINKSKKVIDYWFSRTRYAMKDGKIDRKSIENEPSIITIIEEILSNRVRLIKKSQMKRSSYRTLGKPSTQNENDNSQVYASNYELDKEIYDDEDFYRQLLRQLIESKMSSESIDPIALSRKWLQIQKLRSKMKRKIDTKASKGRKIRYQVYDKLVGFMAPFDNGTYVDKAKDALYRSLFGQ